MQVAAATALASPVIVVLGVFPRVLVAAVWVPQTKEWMASNIRKAGGNAIAILSATAKTPLRYHKLQSQVTDKDSATAAGSME